VLFGQGRRLFEGLAAEQIELERTRILEGRTESPTCTTGSSAEVNVLRLHSRRMADSYVPSRKGEARRTHASITPPPPQAS
jgi:hypothetical protein